MVEEAQGTTAPIQRIADRISGYFVPIVITVAILTFLSWWLVLGNFTMGILSFVAVLIISCPCAIGIATPTALFVGVGKGAEAGILIRGGEYLELAQKLTTVVFDKTGTLTKGEPSVTDVIKKLQAEGKIVAMAGDGINDAPALAQSNIGIAVGSGSDVAKETGGIVLIRDDLRDVVSGIRLSKATMRKIKQNMFWALIYNVLAIPVAAFGLLNPMIAAAAMAMSSLTVVSNSALLRRFKLRRDEDEEKSASPQGKTPPVATLSTK
jgi:cation transport ATPase